LVEVRVVPKSRDELAERHVRFVPNRDIGGSLTPTLIWRKTRRAFLATLFAARLKD
jgi:hypothetical protein